MSCVATIFLLLLLGCNASYEEFWHKLHCTPSTTDVTSFQVYLKWHNEDLLDDYVHHGHVHRLPFDPRGEADIETLLAKWRSVLHPPPQAMDHTRTWLQNGGVSVESSCRVEWDSIHCTGIPIAVASKLFDVEICAYEQDVDKLVVAVPDLRGRHKGAVFWMAEVTKEDIAPSDFVQYVGGISIFDPSIVPLRSSFSGEKSVTGFPTNHYLWPLDQGTAPVSLAALGLPRFGGLSDMGSMTVALMCLDGTPAVAPSFSTLAVPQYWCNLSYPTQIEVSIVGQANPVAVDVNTDICDMALNWMLTTNESNLWATNIVCIFDAHSLIPPLQTWGRYEVHVQTTFSNGMKSDVDVYQNFWQLQYPGSKMLVTNPDPLIPTSIRSLYGIPEDELIESSASAQGILEFSDTLDPRQGFNISDLETYLVQYGITDEASVSDYVGKHLTMVGTSELESRGETSLDVEMMMSLARGAHTYIWNIINGPNEEYIHWAQGFIAWASSVTSGSAPTSHLAPSVWSISYGGSEWNTVNDSTAEMDTLNNYFKLMTASGVTVSVSSGDSGSGFETVAPLVSYPASSPYVVAVGATALRLTDSSGVVEAACSSADGNVITTGGAFSQYFELPAFQNESVLQYIRQHPGYSSLQIPSNRRGVPDVAAIGAWVNVVFSNETLPVFGTSISSPVFSSMISLANDRLRRQSKAPISLANFMVYAAYANRTVFRDVTLGSNCAGEQYSVSANFPTYSWDACYNATVGWDPVSGVGSPDYKQLVAFASNWSHYVPKSSSSSSANHAGAIVGGVIGGLVFVALVVGLLVRCRKPQEQGDYKEIQ